MAEIPIGEGKVALVDDADFEWLGQYSWHKGGRHLNYAATSLRFGKKTGGDGRNRNLFMHRMIAKPGPGQWVHHRNGNTLDNRRCNLVSCSPHMNNSRRSGYTSHGKAIVSIRMTPEEKARIVSAATDAGLCVNSYVLQLILPDKG